MGRQYISISVVRGHIKEPKIYDLQIYFLITVVKKHSESGPNANCLVLEVIWK